MARAYQTYTGDGSVQIFSVTIPYLQKDDITVTVNALPATYVWLTDTSIQITPAPPNGQVVKILRQTDLDAPLVDFVDGANLTEVDLDTATRQAFYATQEAWDELDFWISWIQDQSISGSLALPPVAPSDDNSFLIALSSQWQVIDLATVKSILGIGGTTGVYTTIPDPTGYPGFVFTDGASTFQILGIPETLTTLGLGDLATHDAADFPMLNYVVGTLDGNLVALDGDGTLPALDGSQLTNIQKRQYVRVDERPASVSDNGGDYTVSNSWVKRALSNLIVNEVGGAVSLDTSTRFVSLPAGKYEYRVRSVMRGVNGLGYVRIAAGSGSVLANSLAQDIQSEQKVLEAAGQFTLNSDDSVKVEVLSNGTWADDRALGTASGDSALPPNIYTILEVWKLPS